MTADRPTTRQDVVPEGLTACFGCGESNPGGLHLDDIRRVGDLVTATLRAHTNLQGFPGVLHGGIATAALDEVMGYGCRLLGGVWAATAKMELRFRKPVPDSGSFVLEAGVRDRSKGNRFHMWSHLLFPDGRVGVEATALFLPLPAEVARQMLWSGD